MVSVSLMTFHKRFSLLMTREEEVNYTDLLPKPGLQLLIFKQMMENVQL